MLPELRPFLSESLKGLCPKVARETEAHLTIPLGIVRRTRESFENLIATHVYEADRVYVHRATQNMDELIRQNRTYAEQLRLAESATLFHLSPDLVGFIRDHDNLYRAAVRCRSATKKAIASRQTDVLTQVAYRITNLRNVYYVNIIRETRSPREHTRLVKDQDLSKEFDVCASALGDEIVCQLARLESLLPNPIRDVELENVGPDHLVEDYGHDSLQSRVTTSPDDRDQSHRCCICLEGYTNTHVAFTIRNCKHIVGKSCLSRWLNSTGKNANLCPHCRASLCERRPRRPAESTPTTVAEQRNIDSRLRRAMALMVEAERLFDEIHGTNVVVDVLKETMDKLNFRLFENDIGFCLEYEASTSFTWLVRRVDWHS